MDVSRVLKYTAITLTVIAACAYYTKHFTHLLSPPAVCQADQFCGQAAADEQWRKDHPGEKPLTDLPLYPSDKLRVW